ncbi:MAG: polymer-forming cytoskeletal protein [Akkermansiaceae bacterium]
MALFTGRKNKNTSSKKHTLALSCPECDFAQEESNMAVSTYCRGCGVHYKIADGAAVPIKKNPSNPFATYEKGSGVPKLRDANGNAKSPSSKQPSTTASPIKRTTPPTSSLVKLAAETTGFLQTKQPPRTIVCFECDHVHQAPAEASSTSCPACGAYVGLKDYNIQGNWNRHIQTRGNVILQKKSSVTGITIRCHDLTSHGEFTGGVDCSGDFLITNNGKIMGRVRCKRLIIEKKARVEFANPVTCEDAIIDGAVTGNFTCAGKLSLKKKATLTGDIKVATMEVEEGARHHGRISIGQ